MESELVIKIVKLMILKNSLGLVFVVKVGNFMEYVQLKVLLFWTGGVVVQCMYNV